MWGRSMPVNHAELMGALLAAAAMAMLLQPLSMPHSHPELERMIASINWEHIAEYNACTLGDGSNCLMGP
jgi:hypothetical protein